MKKIVLIASAVAMLLAIAPGIALAGPPSPPDYGTYNPTDLPNQPPEEWGVEKALPSRQAPGGAVRIITDPLAGSDPAAGWVTFWCQSRLGFQYNIGATGLQRLSRYSVRAEGARFQFVLENPGAAGVEIEPGLWILPATVTSVSLDLGAFKTDANGLGGVKGVTKLPSGFVYEVGVVVSDSDDAPVLGPAPSPPPFPPGPDTNGFIVY